MPTYDEISNLSEEEQEQFHRYVQKSLRKQWAKTKNKTETNKTETEIDIERKTKCQT